MLDAVRTFSDGGEALGARVPRTHLRAFEGIVPKGTDWRTLGEGAPSAPASAVPAQA